MCEKPIDAIRKQVGPDLNPPADEGKTQNTPTSSVVNSSLKVMVVTSDTASSRFLELQCAACRSTGQITHCISKFPVIFTACLPQRSEERV